MPEVMSANLMSASESLTTGFTSIATSVTDGIGNVAPIALGVMGVMLVWRVGTRFFKSVAK